MHGLNIWAVVTVLALEVFWAQPQPQQTGTSQPTPQSSPAILDQERKPPDAQASPAANPIATATPGEENRNPDLFVRVQQQPGQDEKSWLRLIWDSLFPWPALIACLTIYLLFSGTAPGRIESLLRPFKSLKLFGQEFVLNQWGGHNAETAIRFYRDEVQAKFDRKVKKLKIVTMHRNVLEQHAKTVIPDLLSKQVRSTIHVPDMLFDEALYQLIDYYPEYPKTSHGRSFPARYGIIGKAWRLEESQYQADVSTDNKKLILEWGMTKEEAAKAGKDRQSFACIILKAGQKPLGIFYLDAPERDAFGDAAAWQRLETAITNGARQTKLINALEALHRDLLDSSPRVQIFSKSGKSS